jgi:FAD/FMN-containing dehydrogenase
MEHGLIIDAAIARSETAARAFWALREGLPAGHRGQGAQANHDISVPVSQAPAFLDAAAAKVEALCPGGRIVAFGHAGDGNIHYSVLQPVGSDPATFPGKALNDAIHEIAVGLGGSISAEHGIGVSRKADFARFKPPEQIAIMRAIKAALDPKGIMNPRVMIG